MTDARDAGPASLTGKDLFSLPFPLIYTGHFLLVYLGSCMISLIFFDSKIHIWLIFIISISALRLSIFPLFRSISESASLHSRVSSRELRHHGLTHSERKLKQSSPHECPLCKNTLFSLLCDCTCTHVKARGLLCGFPSILPSFLPTSPFPLSSFPSSPPPLLPPTPSSQLSSPSLLSLHLLPSLPLLLPSLLPSPSVSGSAITANQIPELLTKLLAALPVQWEINQAGQLAF